MTPACQIIDRMLERFADPTHHVCGPLAVDSLGLPVCPSHPDAFAFCYAGNLDRTIIEFGKRSLEHPAAVMEAGHAVDYVCIQAARALYNRSVVVVSDHLGYDAIMRVLRHAQAEIHAQHGVRVAEPQVERELVLA